MHGAEGGAIREGLALGMGRRGAPMELSGAGG